VSPQIRSQTHPVTPPSFPVRRTPQLRQAARAEIGTNIADHPGVEPQERQVHGRQTSKA